MAWKINQNSKKYQIMQSGWTFKGGIREIWNYLGSISKQYKQIAVVISCQEINFAKQNKLWLWTLNIEHWTLNIGTLNIEHLMFNFPA